MKKWNELTLPEQAAMMKVAVKNGIYNLQDIKAKYNEFAMGGDKEDLKIPSLSEAKRMGVMVGITPFVRQKDYIGGSTSEARDKYWQTDNEMRMLTDSVASQYQINPDLLRTRMDNEGYTDARIKEINKDVKEGANRTLTGEALFHSTSLPYVAGEEFGLDDVGTYINEGTVNLINENWGDGQFLNEHGRWTNMAMGHNYSDNVGIMAATLKGLRELAKKDFPHASDADLDRYASAYYNRGIKGGREWVKNGAKGYKLNKHSIGGPLVEAAMNEYANGGGIHIKPSHRGRLTDLKKRTGKTEAELYRTGSPATRKMITFARNARKWKHGDGGNLFEDGGNPNPMNYDYRGTIFDDELKRQGITHIAELPEITVTGRDPKGYRSAFDGSVQPYIEYFGALSHGLQPLSLSQHVGAAADAIQGKRNYFDSLFNGNSGFFTDKYAAEYPWVSTLGNMAGDISLTYLSTKAISKLPTYMRLEKYYNGVPHRQSEINGKLQFDKNGNPIYMDENFPSVQKDVNVWGVNKADYARNYALDDGKIYKVYADPQELATNILETPTPNKGQYFDWQDLPFILDNQGVTLSKNMKEIAKTGKRSKYRTIDEDYSKLYSPTEGVSTDKVVEHSIKLGKKATRMHSVYDMPLTTFFGKNYSIPVEELVIHKNTNAYVLPHFIPKVKLLFDSQIPYSAKYLTNPFLPVTKYDDKD